MITIGFLDEIPVPTGLNQLLRVGKGSYSLLYSSSDVSRRGEEPRYEFKKVGMYEPSNAILARRI